MSALLNCDPLGLVLERLEGVRKVGNHWQARCPAHDDKKPSLSVKEGQRGVMLKCWSGCTFAAIVDALGLRQSDLFYESLLAPQRQYRATKAILKGACSESLQVLIAASTIGPALNDADRVRLGTAVARLRAALSLEGLPGRAQIERISAFGARILAGELLDEADGDDLTDNVEWVAWLIADVEKAPLQTGLTKE